MKLIFTAIAGILISINTNGQSRYLIKFRDKGTNPFSIANPSQYLGTRALQRRTRYNILIDSLDLPVTPRYIDSIRLSGAVTILNASKWLNQISIRTTDAAALAKINSFPFVISSMPIAARANEQITPINKQLEKPADIPLQINETTFSSRLLSSSAKP